MSDRAQRTAFFLSVNTKISLNHHKKMAFFHLFLVFLGKILLFGSFPPKRPHFHIDFPHSVCKSGETRGLLPHFMGKKGSNLSHFQRSFPQKKPRKPLILRGFRGFSTKCSFPIAPLGGCDISAPFRGENRAEFFLFIRVKTDRAKLLGQSKRITPVRARR